MGHRVAVLSGGRLQQCATPRDLYDNPVNQFVAGFIGSPSMNLRAVPLTEDGARLAGTVLPLPAAARAGLSEIVIGIRPEHLHLTTKDSPAIPGDRSSLLTGEVILVEELGADALLHVRLSGDPADLTAGTPFVARAEGRRPPALGQQVTLAVDPADVLTFHPATGARIAG